MRFKSTSCLHVRFRLHRLQQLRGRPLVDSDAMFRCLRIHTRALATHSSLARTEHDALVHEVLVPMRVGNLPLHQPSCSRVSIETWERERTKQGGIRSIGEYDDQDLYESLARALEGPESRGTPRGLTTLFSVVMCDDKLELATRPKGQ